MAFSQTLQGIDEIAPFSEGLAAVRKGNQWGFINEEGTLVIDYRSDLVWNREADPNRSDITGVRYPVFHDGLCMIKSTLEEEEINVYGFIDTKGNTAIEPEYLNVTSFNKGYAVGILFTKMFRGENKFKLRIYDYKFSEVILDTSGDIMRLIEQRDGIIMNKRRYTLPELRTKLIASDLFAVKGKTNTWEIRKLEL